MLLHFMAAYSAVAMDATELSCRIPASGRVAMAVGARVATAHSSASTRWSDTIAVAVRATVARVAPVMVVGVRVAMEVDVMAVSARSFTACRITMGP